MKRRDFLVAAAVAPLAPVAVAAAVKTDYNRPGVNVVLNPPDRFQVTLEAGSYKVAGLDLHRVNPGPNDFKVLCFHAPAAFIVIKTATYTLHKRSHEGNAYILHLG